jgi:predicted nucleotidyltransferase
MGQAEGAMNRLIEEKRQELERVCRVRRVHRIELFGFAAGSAFDPAHSELDFLVTFQELDPDQYADTYFGLLEDLQALFQRPVDLVVASAIQNPYFRQAVESTRTLVFFGRVRKGLKLPVFRLA